MNIDRNFILIQGGTIENPQFDRNTIAFADDANAAKHSFSRCDWCGNSPFLPFAKMCFTFANPDVEQAWLGKSENGCAIVYANNK